ncbi:V-set and immunoglobulin domain-containing protein 10-like [Toxotes jaculatrix]|uniref:V-set and immunoglobulin domain-containing protein 10-like n=1 Tax=Toxotes jaculatrix TaxID=941984 RepID=UPI001B3A9F88|nr:V-set and immunoglobulin domain-containing protein 10-like [Toxotes jaculatrix]
MTLLDEVWRLSAFFLVILLRLSFRGAYCQLVVSPVGPTRVNVIAGSNVTLDVSFTGAPDPVVTWFMGDLPVVTWTINSDTPPDVAKNNSKVLRIGKDGSLTFVNVLLGYTSNYTIEMTKSGLEKAMTTFTLNVFESIRNVTLTVQPDFVKEGTDQFILKYSMLKGVVEQQMWFFNGEQIKTSSHYLVEQRSLVVLRPNRNDTGWYTVFLMNPFSRVAAHVNVIVLYGSDEPVLTARPAQPFYVSGDSLSFFCQAEGFPQPTAEWLFGGQMLSDSHEGVLNLTNVQTSQGGSYTCTVLNEQTKEQRQNSMILNIYEKPSGNPTCSVQLVNRNSDLQNHCRWLGGAPETNLSFPALRNTSTGAGNFSLTINTSDNLNGKTVTCLAVHAVEQNECNVTARLSISDSSLFPNQDGTIVTLAWEGPPTSGVKGEGLSGPAIAGIAAGIPCSLLFLLLLGGFIYLCVYCKKNRSRQARYPVSRAVDKAVTAQSDTTPHNLLTGGLKTPPDYNRLQQTPSERSVALPTFVPPPPVRVATTV